MLIIISIIIMIMIIGKDYDIVEELEFKFTKEMADLVFECINIKKQLKNEKINNQEKIFRVKTKL